MLKATETAEGLTQPQPNQSSQANAAQPAQVEYSFWSYLNPFSYVTNTATPAKKEVPAQNGIAAAPAAADKPTVDKPSESNPSAEKSSENKPSENEPSSETANPNTAPKDLPSLRIEPGLPVTGTKLDDSPILVKVSPPNAENQSIKFPKKELPSQDLNPPLGEPVALARSLSGHSPNPTDNEDADFESLGQDLSPEPKLSPWVCKPFAKRTFASVVAANLKAIENEFGKKDEDASAQVEQAPTKPANAEAGTQENGVQGSVVQASENLSNPAPTLGRQTPPTGTSPILVQMPPPSPSLSPTIEAAYRLSLSRNQKRRAARRKGREMGKKATVPSI